MLTQTHVRKRQFDLTQITEEEGLVLRTLVNLPNDLIREKLRSDKGSWNDQITEDEAVRIGLRLRTQIFGMLDGKAVL